MEREWACIHDKETRQPPGINKISLVQFPEQSQVLLIVKKVQKKLYVITKHYSSERNFRPHPPSSDFVPS